MFGEELEPEKGTEGKYIGSTSLLNEMMVLDSMDSDIFGGGISSYGGPRSTLADEFPLMTRLLAARMLLPKLRKSRRRLSKARDPDLELSSSAIKELKELNDFIRLKQTLIKQQYEEQPLTEEFPDGQVIFTTEEIYEGGKGEKESTPIKFKSTLTSASTNKKRRRRPPVFVYPSASRSGRRRRRHPSIPTTTPAPEVEKLSSNDFDESEEEEDWE